MDFETITVALVFDVFLLLLIGIGPKIALVPYLEMTAGMPEPMKQRVVSKMIATAAVVALILLVLGELLARLLHFSTGALSIASGIVLIIIAVGMVLGTHDETAGHPKSEEKDPMKLATFPLAVPYLLNPAGIVVLMTISAEAESPGVFLVVLCVLFAVLALDVVVFRWGNQVSARLDPNRMLITEKVFGFLLAALAVQLALNGLADVGVIDLIPH